MSGLASIWAPPGRGRKYCVTANCDLPPPMTTMGMGPFQPAIMELQSSQCRVVCSTFHVSYQYQQHC